MMEPVFWLGLSLGLVAICLTIVLVVAIPAFQELAKAAHSAHQLFDLLSRELPPTLDSLRKTGLELSDLSEEMTEGIHSASQVVKQVDESLTEVKHQVHRAGVGTTSILIGIQTAMQTLVTGRKPKKSRSPKRR